MHNGVQSVSVVARCSGFDCAKQPLSVSGSGSVPAADRWRSPDGVAPRQLSHVVRHYQSAPTTSSGNESLCFSAGAGSVQLIIIILITAAIFLAAVDRTHSALHDWWTKCTRNISAERNKYNHKPIINIVLLAARAHARTVTHTRHARSLARKHAEHAHTLARAHIRTHAHTDTGARARAHTYTYTHIRTHAHTHARTQHRHARQTHRRGILIHAPGSHIELEKHDLNRNEAEGEGGVMQENRISEPCWSIVCRGGSLTHFWRQGRAEQNGTDVRREITPLLWRVKTAPILYNYFMISSCSLSLSNQRHCISLRLLYFAQ